MMDTADNEPNEKGKDQSKVTKNEELQENLSTLDDSITENNVNSSGEDDALIQDGMPNFDIFYDTSAEKDNVLLKTKNEKTGELLPNLDFKSLYIRQDLIRGLNANGFEKMNDLQSKCIPEILENKNYFIQSGPGSGKTVAYLIALLHSLPQKTSANQVSALIVCHSRELVHSTANLLSKLSSCMNIAIIGKLIGGVDVAKELKYELKNPTIIIGTAAKIAYYIKSKKPGRTLRITKLKHLVLENFDIMATSRDIVDDLQYILRATSKRQHTVLTGCFMPSPMIPEKLSLRMAKANLFKQFTTSDKNLLPPALHQYQSNNTDEDRKETLLSILRGINFTQVIIFVETHQECREICDFLAKKRIGASLLNNQMLTYWRTRTYENFSQFKIRVLVATDVLSCVAVSKWVNLVINYNIPVDMVKLIHRSCKATSDWSSTAKGIAIHLTRDPVSKQILENQVHLMPSKLGPLPYLTGPSPQLTPQLLSIPQPSIINAGDGAPAAASLAASPLPSMQPYTPVQNLQTSTKQGELVSNEILENQVHPMPSRLGPLPYYHMPMTWSLMQSFPPVKKSHTSTKKGETKELSDISLLDKYQREFQCVVEQLPSDLSTIQFEEDIDEKLVKCHQAVLDEQQKLTLHSIKGRQVQMFELNLNSLSNDGANYMQLKDISLLKPNWVETGTAYWENMSSTIKRESDKVEDVGVDTAEDKHKQIIEVLKANYNNTAYWEFSTTKQDSDKVEVIKGLPLFSQPTVRPTYQTNNPNSGLNLSLQQAIINQSLTLAQGQGLGTLRLPNSNSNLTNALGSPNSGMNSVGDHTNMNELVEKRLRTIKEQGDNAPQQTQRTLPTLTGMQPVRPNHPDTTEDEYQGQLKLSSYWNNNTIWGKTADSSASSWKPPNTTKLKPNENEVVIFRGDTQKEEELQPIRTDDGDDKLNDPKRSHGKRIHSLKRDNLQIYTNMLDKQNKENISAEGKAQKSVVKKSSNYLCHSRKSHSFLTLPNSSGSSKELSEIQHLKLKIANRVLLQKNLTQVVERPTTDGCIIS